jgi:hypothetical protein
MREARQFALIGMHISVQKMEGPWMRAFTAWDVANYFGLNAREEEMVKELPGVMMSKPVRPSSASDAAAL